MTWGWDPLGASVIETDDRGGGRRPGAGADEPGDRRPVEHGRRVVAGAERERRERNLGPRRQRPQVPGDDR